MAVVRKSDHILLGDIEESFDCLLISGGVPNPEILPVPVELTLGADGLLLTSKSSPFGPFVTLDQWLGSEPYVSGEVFFIPWSCVRGIDSSEAETFDSFIIIHHLDQSQTFVHMATAFARTRLLDGCRGKVMASRDLLNDASLWADVEEILIEHPLLSEFEILEILIEQYGWKECTRSSLDVILWHDELPTGFHTHLWFLDEETLVPSMLPDGFCNQVVDILADGPKTAEQIFEEVEAVDEELDDLFEVLYDPEIPVFKRRRAWYVEENQTEEVNG